MKGLNECQFIGNIGKDIEVRHTGSNVAVASASLAVNERYKDSDGKAQEHTEWINLVFWRKLAEIAGEYLKKGSKVYVSGKLRTREYEKDGKKVYFTQVNVENLIMLDTKGKGTKSEEPEPSAEKDDDLPF